MQRIYRVFVGFLLLLFSTNIVLANTEIIEILIKPSVEMKFLQGLEKEEIKAFQIETILKKIIEKEGYSVEVLPLPKEPLEIVFPKVVIDDVIVYLKEKPSPTTFAIGDKQYYMNTPTYLLRQHAPG